MDAGGLAQMSSFTGSTGLAVPASGLATRRGGQNIKPLSFEALKPTTENESGVPTPRTSRSHLLAGLRTAPKSATTATFPASPTTTSAPNHRASRNSFMAGTYGASDKVFNGPKTSLPRLSQGQTFNNAKNYAGHQQYTADQILAPPEIQLDEHDPTDMGSEYAELVATNMYLAAQKQRLQQQLMTVQAAQQQFQNMGITGSNGAPSLHQAAYQQLIFQQQQQQAQQVQVMTPGLPSTPGNVYTIVDPVTGQQTLYVGQGVAQLNNHFVDQYNANLQQLQHLQLLQQQLQQQQLRQPSPTATPRVQVSPPPPSERKTPGFRNPSPSHRQDCISGQTAPLPPPSANAFRRGHKKSSSLAGTLQTSTSSNGLTSASHDVPKSAGPKSSAFPQAAIQSGTYGPGQGRAGEHPVRQPRGPPNLEELVRKPTAKHDGSKNFAARTRRSAVHNLMRAGISRRRVNTPGSSGSITPISETTEDLTTVTDDESDSGHSGSGSLNGEDVECSLPSSRTSTGSWGAIGSERPSSREKARKAGEDVSTNNTNCNDPDSDLTPGSFASVFKSAAAPPTDGQRKAPMLVLSNAEKRRCMAI